ncbi:response regulator receiver protein [Salinarchaeum sp. Harcht-Bsk1]|uniref:HalX domain-containing protein n=1 Tax=Salinarchaeum sp. Harcht-Bsk1 TaxID=1333523 RepID=UPI00034248D4|nr:HalX domain-containing protein [Salinarchaeum sp. Harcht-Bsk1]AGN00379.1 response regulator receiver protein [Salinarchaeum sp. Harcht-Bsk1]
MSSSRGDGGSTISEESTGTGQSVSVSPPTVLIADGPNRAKRYEQWIQDPFPVRRARSPDEARDEITKDIGVAIAGAGVSDETTQELLELVTVRSPFARAIVVQGDDQPPMLEGAGYDVCLFTPVEKGDLRQAVHQLARISTYERAVSAFFEYTTHAASIQVGKSEEELADHETYQKIQARIEQIKATLERIRSSMDEADRRVLMESIESDPAAGFSEHPSSSGGRHPDRCSECHLDWGTRHGDGLGKGYDQLGAFVWKCTRCGAVQQSASASHQWVARR